MGNETYFKELRSECIDLAKRRWKGWAKDGLSSLTQDADESFHFRHRTRIAHIRKDILGYHVYYSEQPRFFRVRHNRGNDSYKTFDEAQKRMAQWMFQGLR